MPFTVCGSWAAFLYALQGVFSLCGAFSFFVGVRIYAADVFGACKAFSGHCGRCFSFGVAFAVLLFVLGCSVIGLFLSLLRFVGVGGILYRVIFSVPCRWFILPYTAMPIFYHFFPFYFHFLPFRAFSVRGRLKRSSSFFGFCIRGGVCLCETVAGFVGVCRVRTVAS